MMFFCTLLLLCKGILCITESVKNEIIENSENIDQDVLVGLQENCFMDSPENIEADLRSEIGAHKLRNKINKSIAPKDLEESGQIAYSAAAYSISASSSFSSAAAAQSSLRMIASSISYSASSAAEALKSSAIVASISADQAASSIISAASLAVSTALSKVDSEFLTAKEIKNDTTTEYGYVIFRYPEVVIPMFILGENATFIWEYANLTSPPKRIRVEAVKEDDPSVIHLISEMNYEPTGKVIWDTLKYARKKTNPIIEQGFYILKIYDAVADLNKKPNKGELFPFSEKKFSLYTPQTRSAIANKSVASSTIKWAYMYHIYLPGFSKMPSIIKQLLAPILVALILL